jgi:hypothetical protein
MDKALKKSAEDYLKFEADSPLLSDKELDFIKSQYERANNFRKVGANTNAAEIEIEISNFIVSKMTDFAKGKVFETFLYTKPLISGRFAYSSFYSNFLQNAIRVTSSAFQTKGGINFKMFSYLFGSKLGFLRAKNVFTGGSSAMDTQSTESNNLFTERPEKLRMGGLSSLYAAISDVAKRIIEAPDTLGMVTGTDIHFYIITVNKKYDELIKSGKSKSDAKKEAKIFAEKEMKLMAENEAKEIADKVFEEDGQTVTPEFRKTINYKIAVEEIKRSNRDEKVTQRAFIKSSEDYFKSKMTQPSELGWAYNGIMGGLAQLANRAKSMLIESAEKSAEKGNIKTSYIQKVLGFRLFGFLNGTSAFAEKTLEMIPHYAIAKIAALGITGKKLDSELRTEIGQAQRDIMGKMMAGFLLYAMMKGIKELKEENCENKDIKVPENKIYGKYGFSICGKRVNPFIIPPQMEAVFGFYTWLFETGLDEKKDNLIDDSMGAVAMVLSNVRIGNDQPSIKMVNSMIDGLKASKSGNEISANEKYADATNYGVQIGVDFVNSFIPVATRPIQELGSYLKLEQKQFRPKFDINKPEDVLTTIGNSIKYNVANSVSAASYFNLFTDERKPMLDWQGRTIINARAGYWTGDGVQYNKYDDLFAQSKAPLPYLNATREITVEKQKEEIRIIVDPLSYEGREIKTEKKRYLTEDEFYTVQKETAEFSKEFIEKNYDIYMKMPSEDRKLTLSNYAQKLNKEVYDALDKGVPVDKIKKHLTSDFISDRLLKTTKKQF